MSKCSLCDAPTIARGWCSKHYQRWKMHGDAGAEVRRRSGGTLMKNGYFRNENHRYAHIEVAERALGAPLPAGAQVHHINENKLDNRPGNLVICPDSAYHMLLHQRQRAFDASGHADWLRCVFCKQYDAPENLALYQRVGRRPHSMHSICSRDRQRKARGRL